MSWQSCEIVVLSDLIDSTVPSIQPRLNDAVVFKVTTKLLRFLYILKIKE